MPVSHAVITGKDQGAPDSPFHVDSRHPFVVENIRVSSCDLTRADIEEYQYSKQGEVTERELGVLGKGHVPSLEFGGSKGIRRNLGR